MKGSKDNYSLMIDLYYFRDNYGDELSPYLIAGLSGKKVRFCRPFSWKRITLDVAICCRDILFGRGFHNFSLAYARTAPVVLAVGSIVGLARKNCIIWGSGITYRTDPIEPGACYRAVRGPLTLRRLREAGCDVSGVVMGDPGLLLPLIYRPKVEPCHEFGIIAHNNDRKRFEVLLERSSCRDKFLFISLRTNRKSVEKSTDEICSCRRILSSSLHGLIVPHAYGIPALRMESHTIPGDGSKFEDYFSSVGIKTYSPVTLNSENCASLEEMGKLFNGMEKVSLPQVDLYSIRKQLLEAAPFPTVIEPEKSAQLEFLL